MKIEHQYFGNEAKAMLSRKPKALNAYIEKKKDLKSII